MEIAVVYTPQHLVLTLFLNWNNNLSLNMTKCLSCLKLIVTDSDEGSKAWVLGSKFKFKEQFTVISKGKQKDRSKNVKS